MSVGTVPKVEVPTCASHPGEEAVYTCTQCNHAFACTKCVTGVHRGHPMNSLEDTAKSLTSRIQDLLRKRQEDKAKVEKRLEEAQTDFGETGDNLKNLKLEIERRRDKIKTMVDGAADKNLQLIRELETSNKESVNEYSSKLCDLQDRLQSMFKDSESVTLFGTPAATITLLKTLATPPLFPRNFDSQRVKFTGPELTMASIEEMFGVCTKVSSTEATDEPPAIPPRTVQSPTTTEPCSPADGVKSGLLDCVDIQHEPTNDVQSLAFTNNKFLICYKSDRRIIFTNASGKVLRKVRCQYSITGISVSLRNGNPWISCTDGSVIEIESKTQIIRFLTNSKPLCICVRKIGLILIGHANEVVQYDERGRHMLKTCLKNRRNMASLYPRTITECPTTESLAVSYADGISSLAKVAIFDRSLKALSQYPDKPLSTDEFFPIDLCFNANGNLFILERNHNKILCITKAGLVIQETRLHNCWPTAFVLGPRNMLTLAHQSRDSKLLTMNLADTIESDYVYSA